MGLKALIVEADPFCSRVVAAALNDLPAVDTVVAVASGREALARSAHGRFGIVVLDAALPDMLGRTLLLTLKLARPDLRVVALAGASDLTIEAVEDLGRCGAAHVIARPATARAEELVAALRALTNGRPRREPACRTGTRVFGGVPEPAPRAREPVGPARSPAPDCEFWITAIAVSTGGPASLDEVIPRLPADYPHPVVMVQHMPPFFTAVMAKDLDEKSAVRVVEAGDGDRLESGTVYLAPGGRHMRVSRVGGLSRILLGDDPPLNNCRPSADVLFRSLVSVGYANEIVFDSTRSIFMLISFQLRASIRVPQR